MKFNYIKDGATYWILVAADYTINPAVLTFEGYKKEGDISPIITKNIGIAVPVLSSSVDYVPTVTEIIHRNNLIKELIPLSDYFKDAVL